MVDYVVLVVFGSAATAVSAAANRAGSFLSLLSARRKIPFAALEERKKRGGGLGSKISDNEHSTAALGDSEISRVQHSPRNAIPDVGQRRKKDGEIPATARGKESGYVFNEEPWGAKSGSDSGELKEERGARSVEPGSPAGNGEVLAGKASAEKIDSWRSSIYIPHIFIAMQGGPVARQHGAAEGLLLTLPGDHYPGAFEAKVDATNTREERTHGEHTQDYNFFLTTAMQLCYLRRNRDPPKAIRWGQWAMGVEPAGPFPALE